MTLEQRVREALTRYTDGIEPDPGGWARLQDRLRSQRRGAQWRRSAIGAVAVAAILASVLGAVAVLEDRDTSVVAGPGGREAVAKPDPLPPAPRPAPPDAAPPPPVPPMLTPPPPFFVAGTRDGKVVVVSTTSGNRDVLADLGPQPENPEGERRSIGRVILSPDKQWVYYEEVGEPAVGTVRRVRLAGGKPEELLNGSSPALSPDGARLAYVNAEPAIVVRELRTGSERVFSRGQSLKDLWLHDLAWSPEGRRLAFAASKPRQPSFVRVLDVEAHHLLEQADRVSVGEVSSSSMSPAWRGNTGELVVAAQCCWPDLRGEAKLVRVLDGTVLGETQLQTVVADVDYDSTGAHRLLVSASGSMSRTSPASDGSGVPTVLGDGWVSADW